MSPFFAFRPLFDLQHNNILDRHFPSTDWALSVHLVRCRQGRLYSSIQTLITEHMSCSAERSASPSNHMPVQKHLPQGVTLKSTGSSSMQMMQAIPASFLGFSSGTGIGFCGTGELSIRSYSSVSSAVSSSSSSKIVGVSPSVRRLLREGWLDEAVVRDSPGVNEVRSTIGVGLFWRTGSEFLCMGAAEAEDEPCLDGGNPRVVRVLPLLFRLEDAAGGRDDARV